MRKIVVLPTNERSDSRTDWEGVRVEVSIRNRFHIKVETRLKSDILKKWAIK
ncbi:hypothetical protein LEP1GSC163_2849 [Leptospira santarosai str. CBC379]|nr:hypothetical protein LEP1GSC163_2849 [Leptospira santarosai str. CBC379]EMJ47939.1 hypothetical protein LEP1GSC169_0565 [Leptospira santarosai str. HAI1349]